MPELMVLTITHYTALLKKLAPVKSRPEEEVWQKAMPYGRPRNNEDSYLLLQGQNSPTGESEIPHMLEFPMKQAKRQHPQLQILFSSNQANSSKLTISFYLYMSSPGIR